VKQDDPAAWLEAAAFVFRMEKPAGSLGLPVLTSNAVKAQWPSLLEREPAGAHELKGFEGKHEFFSC
jgi:hypothetical protein